MNAAAAFEVVADAMGLIEWLSDEIGTYGDVYDLDTLQSMNTAIWRVADAIRNAANGSARWEDAERVIIAIRKEVSR